MTARSTASTARDAQLVPLTPAQRLAQDAAAAAEVRAYLTDPDVVALRVERARTVVDRLMWVGIGLGLAFTMTNVQHFAATGTRMGSLVWWSAWLLDPMVSLVLLAVLRAEQITTRHHITTGPWPRVAKWFTLAATYIMNTWSSWVTGSVSGVVLHSVAPLVVVIAAEAVTDLQHALTDCVHRAHTSTTQRADRTTTAAHTHQATRVGQATGVVVDPGAGVHGRFVDTAAQHPGHTLGERSVTATGAHLGRYPVNPHAPTRDRATSPVRDRITGPVREPRRRTPGSKRSSGAPVRRKLLADYVNEARSAWTPEVIVTPAWVRQVTACSRGLSPKVAAALNADLNPPYQHDTTHSETEGRAA